MTATTDAVVGTYLLASVGVALEVAFTATASLRARDRRLVGHSYLWMFPIYGLAYPLLTWLWPIAAQLPLLARAGSYAIAFLAVEYTAGWLLRLALGRCPWEDRYRLAGCNIHGLVRLDYAPAWCLVGLLFERMYLSLTVA